MPQQFPNIYFSEPAQSGVISKNKLTKQKQVNVGYYESMIKVLKAHPIHLHV